MVWGTSDGLVKEFVVNAFFCFDDGWLSIVGDNRQFFGDFFGVISFYIDSFHKISHRFIDALIGLKYGNHAAVLLTTFSGGICGDRARFPIANSV